MTWGLISIILVFLAVSASVLHAGELVAPAGNWLAQKLGLQGSGEHGESFVGKIAEVSIPFKKSLDSETVYEGKIAFDGSLWKALATDSAILNLTKEQEVEVERLDGIVLHVKLPSS